MTGIALLIAAVLVASPALAQENCIVTKLKVDCGNAGSGMRTDRGGVWSNNGSTTLDSSAFERDRRHRRDVEQRRPRAVRP